MQTDLTHVSIELSVQTNPTLVSTDVGTQTDSNIQMIDVPSILIEAKTQTDSPFVFI